MSNKQTEREAFHAGYQAGYENGKRDAMKHGYWIDADAFIDHYQSVGWKVGQKPMRDWRAAVRTWVRRDKERGIKPKVPAESSFDENEWMMTNLKRIYGEAGA